MVDKKISQLDENASLALGDFFEVLDLGTGDSQKMTAANVLNSALITALGTVLTGDVDALLKVSNAVKAKFGWVHTVSSSVVSTGDGTDGIPIPAEFNGYNITDVLCTVHDKGITGTTDVQIRRRRAGSDVDVLTVKVTLGDEFFARDATVNTSNDDLATGDILYPDVDAVHSGTAPNGLSIVVIAELP